MKLFGKPKSTAAASDTTSTPDDVDVGSEKSPTKTKAEDEKSPTKPEAEENVPSYFSSETATGSASSKKKKKSNSTAITLDGDDMQVLLAMDPAKLNAKQRRLVRRHKQRDGSAEPPKDEAKSADTAGKDDAEETSKTENDKNDSAGEGATPTEQKKGDEQKASTSDGTDIAEILAKLEGLNSKDRRKFLRQLRTGGAVIDEKVIAVAEEQARKVAERNEKEAANVGRKATAGTSEKDKNSKRKTAEEPPTKPKKKRRKKGPVVDLASLTPEERKRREEQRRMQIEAVAKREAGLVDPDRHPLNSERRRANRRKPSQAMLIAQAKREKIAERGKFHAVGYQMRKGGGEY
mmetsp:Transcript_4638/g.8240  ORF Transcript_4638/g.8240 Transcript_4638/m.8240 type:complete len:349 (+) Transcript_4638:126-1172(+)|eukprot:CAMPEP_0201888698 /NCGR_PEP_ID=MMETSP0902-20130614/28222_1 /ASSEMBLY_ACC=CAM_ASM_000551 /TAXON_ID=420261 /ORGANISM="Thalassiosira antarctica, Strain CCMP982" /LENGTH=348 /DNA_ID=CAMNT_0048419023 /DNA_START=27 /DNA_END=1073 /DNA_ORIENTATION=+